MISLWIDDGPTRGRSAYFNHTVKNPNRKTLGSFIRWLWSLNRLIWAHLLWDHPIASCPSERMTWNYVGPTIWFAAVGVGGFIVECSSYLLKIISVNWPQIDGISDICLVLKAPPTCHTWISRSIARFFNFLGALIFEHVRKWNQMDICRWPSG